MLSPSHCSQVYSLQVLGPVGGLRHGHEAAVGQDGAHDEQTEQREHVKDTLTAASILAHMLVACL